VGGQPGPQVLAPERLRVQVAAEAECGREDLRLPDLAGMRHADVTGDWLPHFMVRVDEAQRLVDDPTNNPESGGADGELLGPR